MLDLNDVHSLTDFKRNTNEYLRHMKETKNPMVLTVNGKAEVVVQDASSYQDMLDLIEYAQTVDALRTSVEQFKHGQGVPVARAFDKIRATGRGDK